jgi:hypothetical protein
MVRLVREDNQRRLMGEAAYQAAAEYDIERTTAAMERQYQNVIAQAQARKMAPRIPRLRRLDNPKP